MDINLIFAELNNINAKLDTITICLVAINIFSFFIWIFTFRDLTLNYIYSIKNKKIDEVNNLNKEKYKQYNYEKIDKIFSLLFNETIFYLFHLSSIIIFILNFNKAPYTMSICISFYMVYFFTSIYQLVLFKISDKKEETNE